MHQLKTCVSPKEYGKLVGEDSKKYFVHCTALSYEDRVRGLTVGRPVEFDGEMTVRGLRAVNVRVLGDSPNICRLSFDGRSDADRVIRN